MTSFPGLYCSCFHYLYFSVAVLIFIWGGMLRVRIYAVIVVRPDLTQGQLVESVALILWNSVCLQLDDNKPL